MTNNSEHISDALMDKLEKLRNLRDGAKAVNSLDEADTAAQMLQALLLKHNLEEEQVASHGIRQKAQMLCSEFDVMKEEWIRSLVHVVSKYCMCRSVGRPQLEGYPVSILGEKENVAMAFYFIEQLIVKIECAYQIA